MELYTLKIHHSFSLDQAWQLMEYAGYEVAYTEEMESQFLHFYLKAHQLIPLWPWIIECQKSKNLEIDWNDQWEQHGYNYQNGVLNIPLSFLGKEGFLKLKPGPGFGDLSHPTTRLILKLLAKKLNHHSVVDIGSGSGILSLAAIQWGASSAWGIEIEEEALEHSKMNAEYNGVENKCVFCLPDHFKVPMDKHLLVMMNMISSEQKIAWNAHLELHSQPAIILTSGIPLSEKESYLDQANLRNWKLEEILEENEWLAFCFNNF